jgi:hypothetical protein
MDRRGFLGLAIFAIVFPPTTIATAQPTRVVLAVDGMT